MADISKKLKLIAELDDRKIKRQISQLKKDLEGLSLKGQDLSAFNKSANILKDAAKDLKDAVNQFRKISPQRINTVSGGGAGAGTGGVRRPSRQAEQMREVFDPEARGGRGRRVRLKGMEEYSQETKTVYKDRMQRLEAERKYQLETAKKVQEAQERADMRRRKKEEQERQKAERRRERSIRGGLAAAGRQAGMQMPVARQTAESLGEFLPGGFTGFGRRMRGRAYRGMRGMGLSAGAARGVMGALGTAGTIAGGTALAGGAIVGAGALGSSMINENIRTEQEFRATAAGRQQEQAFSLLNQQGLTSAQLAGARQRGESGLSGIAGGLGNVLSMRGLGAAAISVFNPSAGARQFSQLYQTGRMGAGQNEIETRQTEMRLALAAGGRARSMRDPRFNALRGGGVTGQQLTAAQMAGADRGFGIQETIDQFTEARQFLGNRGAANNIGAMQNIFNRTGVGVGAQAQAAELLTGTQGGQGYDRSVTQVQEILKKGVAAGLDTSKSGKFLQTTVNYIQQNQGLGDIDVGGVTNRMADFAQGFAGGGPVTGSNLRQAMQLAQMQRTESVSTSGLSGIGNIVGIQQAFQGAGANLDAGTMLALTNLSQDADEDDIRTILRDADLGDITGEQRENLVGRVMESRRGTQSRGANIAFGPGNRNLSRFFRGRERGITTEQQIGAEEAERMRSLNVGLRQRGLGPTGQLAEAPQGAEMASRIAEANQQQAAFVQGMEVMNTRTSDTAANLERLNKEIEKSVRAFRDFQSTSVSRQGGGG